MSTADIILTIVLLAVSIASFIVSYLQFTEKMILLNSGYKNKTHKF